MNRIIARPPAVTAYWRKRAADELAIRKQFAAARAFIRKLLAQVPA